MLEWYRAGEPYEALMEDCAALLRRGRGGGRLPLQLPWRTAPPIPSPRPSG